ncbi:enoyl-CoA hydratase/isomerase family protein [Alkalilimnicola sp. S0819]|uniref:enoyl-CoA hydratase/isomerase family protein n=1 Tax=Alkalilimnicola sp. S0819 TaxID=2613922 RepID=UPI00186A3141|nr:enoyl-CoA hydratase/isomerase family protein [Alkalilimnicola sp. S0819]
MNHSSHQADTRDLVRFGIRDDVAFVELHRPGKHNALVPELLEDFLTRIGQVRDSDAKVLVLQAAGRSFCTGGDMRGFLDNWARIADYSHGLVGQLNEAVMALREIPQPVITAVQGWVTGGGLGFVLGSDVVLLADNARFAPFYVDVGYSPDGGWGRLLQRVIGPRAAAEIQLRNRVMPAEEAVRRGLANEIVDGDPRATAERLAREISRKVPHSLYSTKRLMDGDRAAWRADLEAERQAFLECVQMPGMRERVAEFVKALEGA